jgi:nitrogen fixation NifU-like protein
VSGLEDLYREIMLDHYRSPRNRGELPTPPAVKAEGFNPLCGDEITVYLQLEGSGPAAQVTDICIAGQGCSISQASASMMSAAVKGKTLAEVAALTRTFKGMMSIPGAEADEDETDDDLDDLVNDSTPEMPLGDLEALRGVEKFPVRIKCATLSWNTLAQAITDANN